MKSERLCFQPKAEEIVDALPQKSQQFDCQSELNCCESQPEKIINVLPDKPRSAYHNFVFQETGRDSKDISLQEKGQILSRWWKMSQVEKQLRKNDFALQMIKYRQQMRVWRSNHMKRLWRQRWQKQTDQQPLNFQNSVERTRQIGMPEEIYAEETMKSEGRVLQSAENGANRPAKASERIKVKIEENKQRREWNASKLKRSGKSSSSKGQKATVNDLSFLQNFMALCFGSSKPSSKLPVLEFTITGKINFNEGA